MQNTLELVYERLLSRFGPQHWWPGETPLEIMIGAVLVQSTSWKNVEHAIRNLREAGALHPRRLMETHDEELEELLRPAGYFRVKSRRLRNLMRLVVERHGGSLAQLFDQPLDALRAELLGVNGIGNETADSIILYAAGKPSFVVDAYTSRVLARHGWIEQDADYYSIKEQFESSLQRDAALYNEYHALLVRLGKENCRKTPLCEGCALADLLPPGGPLAAC